MIASLSVASAKHGQSTGRGSPPQERVRGQQRKLLVTVWAQGPFKVRRKFFSLAATSTTLKNPVSGGLPGQPKVWHNVNPCLTSCLTDHKVFGHLCSGREWPHVVELSYEAYEYLINLIKMSLHLCPKPCFLVFLTQLASLQTFLYLIR